jgi:hypothetical protein
MALLKTKNIYLVNKSLLNNCGLVCLSKNFNNNLSNTNGSLLLANSTSKKTEDEKQANKIDLTFENSEIAFKAKSNFDLIRGYIVFRLCGINYLIDNQKTLLNVSRKLLGKSLFSSLMKNTFYGHFVAGENQDEIRANVTNMMKYGVKPILDYSAEEDLESNGQQKESQNDGTKLTTNRNIYDPTELQSEKNLKIFMDCIDVVESEL